MEPSKLAQLMLEYEKSLMNTNDLADKIKAAVLELGKTQTVGNVRASYSKGRKRYDYKAAGQIALIAEDLTIEDLAQFTKTIPATINTDWTALCKAHKITAMFTQSAPSVTLKLVE